ncbi:hypothetical protein [Paenibacillus sp. CGMCC 1.18879]|uniref:phosphoribosyltransferase-like protein n=1 Tax=Paenibacillus sp. CGMCC 1.18879 TaxID=2834466 RepID=UPI001CA83F62|nr:hypothetical protein [Paenibacillus sp. CGMCC 1.18879]MBY9077126.1 hypothetical protein [Paenibacillus sp. CGMCC 1.18879]
MKYPISIHNKLLEVEDIISSWPVSIDIDHVIKWILQFDSNDYHIALRVINHLNVIGYDDMNSALQVAYSRLLRIAKDKGTTIKADNTLFAGIGDAGKSGSMISYHFRMINDVSEENFLDEDTLHHLEKERVENIVLLDDVISTGNQATKEINVLTEKVTPFKVKNIFLLTVSGMRDGITKVTDETKALTFSAFEYGREDTINSLDSKFYEGVLYDSRKALLERIEYYGKISSNSNNGLGYGGIGGLIVFPYNTPNSTLPIIWSDRNGWIALFKRVRRVNGISSYYRQMDKAIEAKVKQEKSQVSTQKTNNLNLYVEGKIDEEFFNLLIQEYDLTNKLKVDKINVIALGGAFFSESLIKILTDLGEKNLFLFEDDTLTHPGGRGIKKFIEEKFPDLPVIYLEPSIMQFLDIKNLLEDAEVAPSLEKLLGENITIEQISSDQRLLNDIERHLKMKFRNRLKHLLHKFIDVEKVGVLVEQIFSRLHQPTTND